MRTWITAQQYPSIDSWSSFFFSFSFFFFFPLSVQMSSLFQMWSFLFHSLVLRRSHQPLWTAARRHSWKKKMKRTLFLGRLPNTAQCIKCFFIIIKICGFWSSALPRVPKASYSIYSWISTSFFFSSRLFPLLLSSSRIYWHKIAPGVEKRSRGKK